MDEMTSTEFRKVYAKLKDRTAVTVNGHVIGTWVPMDAPTYRMETPAMLHADEDVVEFRLGSPEQQAVAADRIAQGKAGVTLVDRFNSKPFTPVPKGK